MYINHLGSSLQEVPVSRVLKPHTLSSILQK